jgi:UDP-N-acetylglucosamine/UDP-N-acetylgalactosamine diphosphorylase
MMVIEYSEIPQALAEAVDSTTGKLLFGAANICNHYFSFAFVKELIPNLARIYHLAEKKIPFYDPVTKHNVSIYNLNIFNRHYFSFTQDFKVYRSP